MKVGIASLGAVAVVLLSAAASADPGDDAGEGEGERLYREGKALIQEGRLAEALSRLRDADEVDASAEIELWVGYVEERLGNLLDAKKTYAAARDVAASDGVTHEAHDAEAALASLATKIPRISVRLPPGAVATVRLDRVTVSSPETGIEVDPGVHTVVVEAAGRQTVHANVIAKAGELYLVEASSMPFEVRAPAAVMAPPPRATPRPVPQGENAAGPVALGVVGAGVAMFGATLLADRDTTMRDIGTGTLIGGLAATGVALLWGIAVSDAPADPTFGAATRAKKARYGGVKYSGGLRLSF